MKNLILAFLLFTTNSLIFGQDLHQDFLRQIDTVENNLEYLLDGNEYIVYATSVKILYIINFKKSYYELIFEDKGNGFKLKKISILKDKILKDLFDKRNYEKGYVDINSNFYKAGIDSVNGLPSYFSYRLKTQEKYCEYLLSVIIDPVPFNKKIFDYISLRYLKLDK